MKCLEMESLGIRNSRLVKSFWRPGSSKITYETAAWAKAVGNYIQMNRA